MSRFRGFILSIASLIFGCTSIAGASPATDIFLIFPGQTFNYNSPTPVSPPTPSAVTAGATINATVYLAYYNGTNYVAPNGSKGVVSFTTTTSASPSGKSPTANNVTFPTTPLTLNWGSNFYASVSIVLYRTGSSISITPVQTSPNRTSHAVNNITVNSDALDQIRVVLPGQSYDAVANTLTGSPDPQTAGTPFSTTIYALDQWRNNLTSSQTVLLTTTATSSRSNESPTIGSGGFGTGQAIDFAGNAVPLSTSMFRAGETPTITAAVGSITYTSSGLTVNPAAIAIVRTALPDQTLDDASGDLTGTVQEQTAGTAFHPTLYLLDTYENLCTNAASPQTVSFATSFGASPSGNGPTFNTSLPGTGLSIAFANGTSTEPIDALITRAGSGTITATVNGVPGVSSSVTVNPGAADLIAVALPDQTWDAGTYAMSGTPPAQTAGAAFAATIYAYDLNRNPLEGAHPVTFGASLGASPSGQPATFDGVNAGTSQSVTFSNGASAAAISARVFKAGSGTISATIDGVQGTSSSFAVNPASATLVRTAFPNQTLDEASGDLTGTLLAQTAGTMFNTTLYVLDTWENRKTDFDGSYSVTFATTAHLPPLAGTYPRINNATFYTGYPTGPQSITFTDGVSPAIATYLYKGESGVSITATVTGVTNSGTSSDLTVNPPAGYTIVRTALPGQSLNTATGLLEGTVSTQTAGTPIYLTLYLLDQYLNLCTNFTMSQTVYFSTTFGLSPRNDRPTFNGYTSGAGQIVNFSGGTSVTIDARIYKPELGAIEATVVAKNGWSSYFTVNPGSGYYVRTAMPNQTLDEATGDLTGTVTAQTAGTQFTTKLYVLDRWGNRKTDLDGSTSVTFATTASLSPSDQSPTINGATFRNGTPTTAQSITFTDGVSPAIATILYRAESGVSITATVTGVTNTGPSSAITVNPAPGISIVRTALPGQSLNTATGDLTGTVSPQYATSSFSVTLYLLDQYENRKTDVFTSLSVTFATTFGSSPRNDPPTFNNSPPGTSLNIAFSSGASAPAISARIYKAGSGTITATVSSVQGVSSPVTVNPGAASLVRTAMPNQTLDEASGDLTGTVTAQTAGTQFTTKLYVLDLYENRQTNFDGSYSVTFSTTAISSPSGHSPLINGASFLNGYPTTAQSISFTDGVSTDIATYFYRAESGVTITANVAGAGNGTSSAIAVTPASTIGVVRTALPNQSLDITGYLTGTVIPQTAGTPFALTLYLLDQYLNRKTDISTSQTVSFATAFGSSPRNDPPTFNNSPPGTSLNIAFSSGTSTTPVDARIYKAGSGTITATVNSIQGVSSSVNVFPSTATFVRTAMPNQTLDEASGDLTGTVTAQTAGTQFATKLYVLDTYENKRIGFTGMVGVIFSTTASLSPSNAWPLINGATFRNGSPTSSQMISFADGVSTNVSTDLYKVESGVTITATVSSVSNSGTSSGITVNPAATSIVRTALPGQTLNATTGDLEGTVSQQTAGTLFSPTIYLLDMYENLKTDFSASQIVYFSTSFGVSPRNDQPTFNGNYPGTGQSIGFSGGTSVTIDARIFKAGSGTITAIAGSIQGVSSSFTVNPGSGYYVRTALPNQTLNEATGDLAGTAQAQTVGTQFATKLYVLDTYGNRKTDSDGPFSVTFSTTAHRPPLAGYNPKINNATFYSGYPTGAQSITFTDGVSTDIATYLHKAESGVTITAIVTGVATSGTSSSFTVNAGATYRILTKLSGQTFDAGTASILNSPQSVTAGSSTMTTLYLLDEAGNLNSGIYWSLNVTFQTTATAAPSGTTPVIASNAFGIAQSIYFSGGVSNDLATFFVRAPESPTITASISGVPNSGQSSAITVIPGSVNVVRMVLPGQSFDRATATVSGTPDARIAGTSFTTTLYVLDPYRNGVSSPQWVTFSTNATSSPSGVIPTMGGSPIAGSRYVGLTDGAASLPTVLTHAGETPWIGATVSGFLSTSSTVVVDPGAVDRILTMVQGQSFDAATGTLTGSPSAMTAGSSFTTTLHILDALRNVKTDVDVPQTVTFTSTATASPWNANPNIGGRTFGSAQNVPFTNGVSQSIWVFFFHANTARITASIEGIPNDGESADITTGPNATYKILVKLAGQQFDGATGAITDPPSPVTAGVTFGTTLYTLDAYGNLNTNQSSTNVTFATAASVSPSGYYPRINGGDFGTTRSVSISNGASSALDTYLFGAGGPWVVTASISGVSSANSSSFTVNPGSGHYVRTAMPNQTLDEATGDLTGTVQGQTAGTQFTTKLYVLDYYENRTTDLDGTRTVVFSTTADFSPSNQSPTINGSAFWNGMPTGAQSIAFTDGVSPDIATYLYKAESGVTIAAAISGVTNSGTSSALTVNPGALAVVRTAVPNQTLYTATGDLEGTVQQQTAGASFGLTIYLLDQYKNKKTDISSTQTVTLTTTFGSSPSNAAPTFNTFPAGTGLPITFSSGTSASSINALISKAGSGMITATVGGIVGASSSFTVNPGGGYYVRTSVPNQTLDEATGDLTGTVQGQTAGTQFTTKLYVLDYYENRKTDFDGTYTVVFSTTANLSPSSQSPAINGATFRNGVPTGTQWISFTDGVSPDIVTNLYKAESGVTISATVTGVTNSGTSASISVNTGAAYIARVRLPGQTWDGGTFTVSGTPDQQTAGTSFTTTVYAYDQWQNAISSSKQVWFGTSATASPSNVLPSIGGANFAAFQTVAFANGVASLTAIFTKAGQTPYISAGIDGAGYNSTQTAVAPGNASMAVVRLPGQSFVDATGTISGEPSVRSAGTFVTTYLYVLDALRNRKTDLASPADGDVRHYGDGFAIRAAADRQQRRVRHCAESLVHDRRRDLPHGVLPRGRVPHDHGGRLRVARRRISDIHRGSRLGNVRLDDASRPVIRRRYGDDLGNGRRRNRGFIDAGDRPRVGSVPKPQDRSRLAADGDLHHDRDERSLGHCPADRRAPVR